MADRPTQPTLFSRLVGVLEYLFQGVLPPSAAINRARTPSVNRPPGLRPEKIDSSKFSELEQIIGYTFKDRYFLIKALTHSSYANEREAEGIPNNERLEFLGDAVLDLVISEYLFTHFPEDREGVLTQKRSNIVSTKGLYKKGIALELPRFLRLGRGEEKTGGRKKKTIVADAVEALVAAIYLDGGHGAVKDFVLRISKDELDRDVTREDLLDHMSLLQSIAQERFNGLPRYKQVAESGPSHDRTYTIKVMLDKSTYGVGDGPTKKSAKMKAAESALTRIQSEESTPIEEDEE